MKGLFYSFLLLAAFTANGQSVKLYTYDQMPEIAYPTADFIIHFSVFHMQMAFHFLDTPTQKKYDIAMLKDGSPITVSSKTHAGLKKLIDKETGAFLLLGGRAVIERKDHTRLTTINYSTGIPKMLPDHMKETLYTFTDPKDGKMIFQGMIAEPCMKGE